MSMVTIPDPLGAEILPVGVFSDLVGVEGLLAHINLSVEDLREAALVGVRAYLECTPHDPIHLPGSLLSGKAFRGLCDILVPRGWRREDRRGHSTVVNPQRTVALTTALGNHDTGIVLATPRTRAAKGVETRAFIEETQLSLFPTDAGLPLAAALSTGRIGLVLLMHAFSGGRRVNLELSIPTKWSSNGYISAWRTRLILPPIPLDGDARLSGVAPPAPAPQRSVEVQRKSS